MAKDNKSSLLHKLRSLYTRLFLVALHNRIHSYHPSARTNDHHDLSGLLYKLIDEIVGEVSHCYTPLDYQHAKFLDIGNSLYPPDTNLQVQTTTTVSMTLNGLSLFLKKQDVLENAPTLSERLKRCVWDHVHSAHRCARFGDAKTAKLHADIACNAMKSLAHYMPGDEYAILLIEMNSGLNGDNNKNTFTTSQGS